MRGIHVAAIVIAFFAWQLASSLSRLKSEGSPVEAGGNAALQSQPSSGRLVQGTRGIVTLPASPDGHVRVSARIGHFSVPAIVDTGATVVALRESDARRLGLRFLDSDFTAVMHTANGQVRGTLVMLPLVEVAGLVVRDVKAVVLPDASLATNLLGLSYLRRLDRYAFSRDSLTLEN